MIRLSDCKALIFDCDGVLVDSEIIQIAAERELLSELGLTYSHETYLSRFVGLSNPDFYAALATDYEAEYPGKTFPADFGEQLFARFWPRIESELKPIEGAGDLAKAFPGKIAVGSNAPLDRLKGKLSIARLLRLFEPHVYSADHVAKAKPAPDLYLHTAAKLGVAPQDCAVIEDSINGIKAARAAGMFAIGFTGGEHADLELGHRLAQHGAQLVVCGHSEVLALL